MHAKHLFYIKSTVSSFRSLVSDVALFFDEAFMVSPKTSHSCLGADLLRGHPRHPAL